MAGHISFNVFSRRFNVRGENRPRSLFHFETHDLLLSLLRGWLDDPHLVAWGYCQEVSTYLPTDALLQEGGYEVINANWYDELGPAPFATGVDEVFRQGFEALARRLATY